MTDKRRIWPDGGPQGSAGQDLTQFQEMAPFGMARPDGRWRDGWPAPIPEDPPYAAQAPAPNGTPARARALAQVPARAFTTTPAVAEVQLDAANYGAHGVFGSNIAAAWKWTAGQGVGVALIDDGFTPGVLANFSAALSRSFAGGGLAEPAGAYHGTTTSGLIGANGAGTGLVGIAEGATLVGVKVSFSGAPFSQFTAAMNYAASAAAIVSNSWGFGGYNPGALTHPGLSAWNAAVQSAVANGRGGLGDVVVFAAGNDRAAGGDIGVQPVADDPRVIAVAAATAAGTVAAFSSGGSGLLVAAIGAGVAVPAPNAGATYIASGTSYSAPTVAGIVAMMLSVNPSLGWRDVQEILAACAYAPAPSLDGFVTNSGRGWNGGGMHFSDDLGFGVVDAAAAVDLSRAWSARMTSTNLSTAAFTQAAAVTLTANASASSTLAVTTALRVEHVQVQVGDTGLPLAHTRLVLVSPSGTRSVLLNDTSLVGGVDLSGGLDLSGAVVTSNAFWGEAASGTWTLELQDAGGAVTGTLKDWTLTVDGDAAPAAATPLIYTPEFARLAAADATRAFVSSAGTATRTIDLIDLPGATTIDLNGGAGLIDGIGVSVAAGLANLNAQGSTGALAVTTARTGGSVSGGDGPTSIRGGGGADTVMAGAGATTVAALTDTRMTFVAGTGGSTVFGGPGALSIVDGPALDTLVVQLGSSGGAYVVKAFADGTDKLLLLGYAGGEAASALALQVSDRHGGSSVALSDGTHIDFVGKAHLQASIFA